MASLLSFEPIDQQSYYVASLSRGGFLDPLVGIVYTGFISQDKPYCPNAYFLLQHKMYPLDEFKEICLVRKINMSMKLTE